MHLRLCSLVVLSIASWNTSKCSSVPGSWRVWSKTLPPSQCRRTCEVVKSCVVIVRWRAMSHRCCEFASTAHAWASALEVS